MSLIITPGNDTPEEQPQSDQAESPEEPDVPEYESTDEDEERFFLMYHFHWSPSEVERLNPSYRRWLISRFVAQKSMEREAMERRHLMSQIGGSLKV